MKVTMTLLKKLCILLQLISIQIRAPLSAGAVLDGNALNRNLASSEQSDSTQNTAAGSREQGQSLESISTTSDGDISPAHTSVLEEGNSGVSKLLPFKSIKASLPFADSRCTMDDEGLIKTSVGILVESNHTMYADVNRSPQIRSPKLSIGVGGISTEGNVTMLSGTGLHLEKGGDIFLEDGQLSLLSSTSVPLTVTRNVENKKYNCSQESTLLIQQIGRMECPHIEVVSEGASVFKVHGSGKTTLSGGILVEGGGINIKSGGIEVEAGGVVVNGGLKIKSGSLDIEGGSQGMHFFSEKGIDVNVSGVTFPALTGRSTNPSFRGVVAMLEAIKPDNDDEFEFLAMNVHDGSNQDKVLSVSSSGMIKTEGGLATTGNIASFGQMEINGGLTMKRKIVRASNDIKVSEISSISFLEIAGDNIDTENNLIFEGEPGEGQILLVKNSDEQELNGPLGVVPPTSTLLYVHSTPSGWFEVTISAAKYKDLDGVSSLHAINDIDIGNHTFEASNLVIKAKSDIESEGQLAFFGRGGKLSGDSAMKINPITKEFHVNRLSASFFTGRSLNFEGAAITNAALTNATISGLQHLSVDTLEIVSEKSNRVDANRMAIISPRGGLSTVHDVMWDERKRTLKVPTISSLSSCALEIDSDIDLKWHKIRNFELEEKSTLKRLVFEDGIIRDTKLINVTTEDLTLGAVEADKLTLMSLKKYAGKGFYITVGENGLLEVVDGLQRTNDNLMVFNDKVLFGDSINFDGQEMENIFITSGRVNGKELDIVARNIVAETISLTSPKTSKAPSSDKIAIIGNDGKIKAGNVTLQDGWMGDVMVKGEIQFRKKRLDNNGDITSDNQGKILNALIKGGRAIELEELSVEGVTNLSNDLNIQGETFIEGSLTVSGSVLGSGPYIDVSDAKFKRNVKLLNDKDIDEKLAKLQAVSYHLDHHKIEASFGGRKIEEGSSTKKHEINDEQQQIGYIAQDVQNIFPEVVQTNLDGSLGLQYARLVPLITESMKRIRTQIADLEDENKDLRKLLHTMIQVDKMGEPAIK